MMVSLDGFPWNTSEDDKEAHSNPGNVMNLLYDKSQIWNGERLSSDVVDVAEFNVLS